jgi:16S rRNA (guanine(966)-N(2))-methyltransferase RsmD
MRVIAGSARGKKLGELTGMETRPTTDRVKESVFNIIQFDIPGSKVLDLFGGTGQLGIECLSRGAERAVFVDQRKDAVTLIRKNLKDTRLEGKGQVYQQDSMSYLASCREKFDLIFLDPPYRTNLLENAINQAVAIDILSETGIMICESPVDKVLPEVEAPYYKGKEYRYGKIKVTLYRKD